MKKDIKYKKQYIYRYTGFSVGMILAIVLGSFGGMLIFGLIGALIGSLVGLHADKKVEK